MALREGVRPQDPRDRPRVREVTGGRRDIFDRLGYGLPTTS